MPFHAPVEPYAKTRSAGPASFPLEAVFTTTEGCAGPEDGSAGHSASMSVSNSGGELGSQSSVLGFQRLQALAQGPGRLRDLGFGEARRDVLRAVPVEGFEAQQQDPLGLGLIAGIGGEFGERGIGVER